MDANSTPPTRWFVLTIDDAEVVEAKEFAFRHAAIGYRSGLRRSLTPWKSGHQLISVDEFGMNLE